ncbi:MAG: hypothetical protein DRG11_01600 [Epsilonproteobacteria bacterium]|nr:MAG: hypothetical protein DRG11_01600 [Campylobacterota bacterium]
MKKLFYIFLLLPIIAFSQDTQTDIVPRSVNFLIFIAIVYYILADKIKAYFKNRTAQIENRFKQIKELELSNKKMIDNAQDELLKAKTLSLKIVNEANANKKNIKQNILNQTTEKINHLIKKTDENLSIQTQKLKFQAVDNFMDKIFENKNVKISSKEISNIIKKKVV